MSYIGQNAPNLSECVLGDPSALTIMQWASQDYSPKDVVVENCIAFDTKKKIWLRAGYRICEWERRGTRHNANLWPAKIAQTFRRVTGCDPGTM